MVGVGMAAWYAEGIVMRPGDLPRILSALVLREDAHRLSPRF